MTGYGIETVNCAICDLNEHKKIGDFIFNGKTWSLVECQKCGLAYVSPRLSRQEMKKYFQSYTTLSDDKVAYWRANKLDRVKQNIQLLNRSTPKGGLLDIGFGYGFFLEYAQRYGWRVAGLEVSSSACDYVREKLQIEVVCGDLDVKYFIGRSFDAVTLFDVLYYSHDPLMLLQQVRTILKDNGVLMLSIINRIQYFKLSLKIFNMFKKDKQLNSNPFFVEDHLYYFSVPTIKKILKKAGYKKIEIFNARFAIWPNDGIVKRFLKKTALLFADTIKILSLNRIYLAPSITIMARKG